MFKMYQAKTLSISLFVFLFSIVNNYSQESEKLFHKLYSKITFVYQPSKLEGGISSNNNGSIYPNMSMKNSTSSQFGFHYNFAQKGRFNFKTGLIAKEIWPIFDLNINDADTGISNKFYLTDFEINNAFLFSIPLKTECFVPLTKKIDFVLGLGISLDILTGGNEDVYTSIDLTTDTQSKTIFTSKSKQEQRRFSGEISTGFNYKTKYALLQLEIFYNQNLLTPTITGDYVIKNLANTPDTFGSFTINSNFYGLSLSISAKKGWLKRNSKK